MLIYLMTDAEMELAELIWADEPLGSGELVRLAAESLGWKKSTTYTVLRKLCKNGIFQNENAVVSARMSREEYVRRKGERYLDENYGGSLPGFVAAFLKRKKLSRQEIEELAQMIEEYREDEG
ncbi:BlaI/MecI/CopY family transcriptional regulator [Lachnoclostridium sp. An131]|uniref:BlaI/MecI/CopY family transcriptional regulator n=1 Tax=Lachnoclostridium sp. An131 TaxID=1965555 RepID=UPI000B381219|nr:BlaI/MecI/CopY family transcriptional regulator [Lachnoclostridium sp. An131]OUQ28364.1 BlaI/MecI/CopY family transcriptional regulator [Lachnoclostridium sp. An131]